MSEPPRMLDTNVGPHLRRLLEAGRDAEPHSSLVDTTLQSLRTASLGTAPSSLAPLGSSMVIPAVAGVLLSLGLLVGVTWTMLSSAPPVAPSPATQAAPREEEPAEGLGPSNALRPEPSAQVGLDPGSNAQPGAAARSSSATAPPSNRNPSRVAAQPTASAPPTAEDAAKQRSRSSTTAQRDLVLRARAALDGGAPQQTLTILAGYETSFDELRFVPEVLSLRMQAHQRLGNAKAAEQLARRIIATYPRSSQAGRARQLLGDGESRGK